MLHELNDIQKYNALNEQVKDLSLHITSACSEFVSRKMFGLEKKFEMWDMNDRKTLIIIKYSYVDDNKNRLTKEVYCSFDEIQAIMDEDKPHVKGLDNYGKD